MPQEEKRESEEEESKVSPQPVPATGRGVKRKMQDDNHNEQTGAAASSRFKAAAAPPAAKKPTAASRRVKESKVADSRAADVFDIDSSFESMDFAPSPSSTSLARKVAAPPALTTSTAVSNNRSTGGTLGVRGAQLQLPAVSKPAPLKLSPTFGTSKTARSRSPRPPISPQPASTIPASTPTLPHVSRVTRTVSSPAKLSTVQKRQKDGAKQKQRDGSDDDDEFDLLRELRLRDPTRSASSIIAAAGKVRRALTAIEPNNTPQTAAGKAVKTALSNPLPGFTSTSANTAWDSPSAAASVTAVRQSASSPASALQFSSALSGSDRQLMESLMYTLDGCSSTNQSVRHSSARSLLQQFQQAQQTSDDRGNALLFLMRAHGGFEQLCAAFGRWVDQDHFMMEVFVACMYFLSKEKGNAQCITKEGIDILMAALDGHRDLKHTSDTNQLAAESKQDKSSLEAEGAENDTEPAFKIRSARKKRVVDASADDIRAVFMNDPAVQKRGLPFSLSLFVILALSAFSNDGLFKTTLARLPCSFSTLLSCVQVEFDALVQLSPPAVSSPPPLSADTPPHVTHLFRLQALLVVLENLTHSHPPNQQRLLAATLPHNDSSRPPPSTPVSFSQLFFAMLQWFTSRVMEQHDQPTRHSNEMDVDETAVVKKSADRGKKHVSKKASIFLDADDLQAMEHAARNDHTAALLSSIPTDASIVLLLCRLLVNLTNKSPRGIQILYHSYPASPPPAGPPSHNKTGVQIMSDIVGLCWYHPHVRPADGIDGTADGRPPRLNADSELLDLLTLSIGVMINTAEHSPVIREVLLENCNMTVRRQLSVALTGVDSMVAGAGSSLMHVSGAEVMQVSYLECIVDVFVHTFNTIRDIEAQTNQPQATTASANKPSAFPTLSPTSSSVSTGVAAPQRYGSRAHSTPIVAATPVDSVVDEHDSLFNRMLCSYAAMVLAILATHDSAAFKQVQAALRGRRENEQVSHRLSPTPESTATSAEHDLLYDASPSHAEAGGRQSPSASGAGQVVFGLRLVVRLLNEFLVLQHESVMSEESVDSMMALIAKLERAIKQDNTYGR